jgi:hypothetical protein
MSFALIGSKWSAAMGAKSSAEFMTDSFLLDNLGGSFVTALSTDFWSADAIVNDGNQISNR